MGRRSETIRYHRMIDAGETPTEKPCAGCEQWLPVDDFGLDRSRKDGRANFCRPCARVRHKAWVAANVERHRESSRRRAARQPKERKQDHHRKHRYGMEPGQFESMKAAQGGRCAICKQEPRARLVVDHAHSSSKVRGLLCDRCNHALHIVERPELLAAAVEYLAAHDDDHLTDPSVVGSAL